jgi:hypothetical protein
MGLYQFERNLERFGMLPLNLDDVLPSHIAALVVDKVAERKGLEYKDKLSEGNDKAKKEFLADVCSFANAGGGDILYGIRDLRSADNRPTGIPESIVGLTSPSLTVECDRLERIIRDGITPRIPFVAARVIEVETGKPVILLRIGRSWIKPHMVTFAGTSRFYSRNSAGKFQMDVQEIGQSFDEQRALGDRLREWVRNRLSYFVSHEEPVTLTGPCKLIVHFIPAVSLFGRSSDPDWCVTEDVKRNLKPTNYAHAFLQRYNSDGFLAYADTGQQGQCAAYAQVFRSGCLEFAEGYLLNAWHIAGKQFLIPSIDFERTMASIFENGLEILNRMGVEDPVYVSCALVNVGGYRLSRENFSDYLGGTHAFDREVIVTPEILITDRREARPYKTSLLPIINSIWQANGYESSPFMNKPGGWDPFKK